MLGNAAGVPTPCPRDCHRPLPPATLHVAPVSLFPQPEAGVAAPDLAAWAPRRGRAALLPGGAVDYLLALLIAFPDVPLPSTVPPAVHDALVQFATRHDLSTPSESWANYPFRSGVQWCSHTLLTLKDCPPSTDSGNFPPAEWCDHELARNAAHVRNLEVLADFNPSRWGEYQASILAAGERATVWYAARDAQRGHVASRRDALGRLKRLVGEADYYAGRLPPGVPD